MEGKMTRRDFIAYTGAALLSAGFLPSLGYSKSDKTLSSGFKTLLGLPDEVAAVTENGALSLSPNGAGAWESGGVSVLTGTQDQTIVVRLSAPKTAVKRISMSWRGDFSSVKMALGDHWERAYGDLRWDTPDAGRVMPWYFLAFDGKTTNGYGVRTGTAALCFWNMSPDKLTLTCDVRSGGRGVSLGDRVLDMCEVCSRIGGDAESPYQAARAFCAQMCPAPRLLPYTVFGSNDWYYSYGLMNTSKNIVKDARFIVSLSPGGANKPFTVVDAGWQPEGVTNGGPWDRGNTRYPSMPKLAKEISEAGARPGIWVRPLAAAKNQPASWRLSRSSDFLDPTIPEVSSQITKDIARFREWGYELVKHDFTTYDIVGRWGGAMGGEITNEGWTFADKTKTTAEVILGLYRTIREAAGDAVVIGCNTVSHLSAGLFELNRIGDDTSGKDWPGTRKNGVNSLAFRAPQHNTFYAADADCVGLVQAGMVPWDKNRQWLDLLARSGTPMFISLNRNEIGDAEKQDIKEALKLTAAPAPPPEPLDWMENQFPQRWKLMGQEVTYNWY